jgi:hypothetical protein
MAMLRKLAEDKGLSEADLGALTAALSALSAQDSGSPQAAPATGSPVPPRAPTTIVEVSPLRSRPAPAEHEVNGAQDGPPLLDRHTAVGYARHQARKAGKTAPTSKRLTATDLPYLGLVGLWPTAKRWIKLPTGPAQVLPVTVWQIYDGAVAPLGTADIFAVSLMAALPAGQWSVGTVRKGRSYAFKPADPETTASALRSLPEQGTR